MLYNKKYETYLPTITVKHGKRNYYCHEVDIFGPSKIVYRPNECKPCGASVWLEIDPSIRVVPKVFARVS